MMGAVSSSETLVLTYRIIRYDNLENHRFYDLKCCMRKLQYVWDIISFSDMVTAKQGKKKPNSASHVKSRHRRESFAV